MWLCVWHFCVGGISYLAYNVPPRITLHVHLRFEQAERLQSSLFENHFIQFPGCMLI